MGKKPDRWWAFSYNTSWTRPSSLLIKEGKIRRMQNRHGLLSKFTGFLPLHICICRPRIQIFFIFLRFIQVCGVFVVLFITTPYIPLLWYDRFQAMVGTCCPHWWHSSQRQAVRAEVTKQETRNYPKTFHSVLEILGNALEIGLNQWLDETTHMIPLWLLGLCSPLSLCCHELSQHLH